MRAVSSPHTYDPAPARTSIAKSKPEAKIFFPKRPFAAGLLDGLLESLDGEGVFTPDVDIAFMAPMA